MSDSSSFWLNCIWHRQEIISRKKLAVEILEGRILAAFRTRQTGNIVGFEMIPPDNALDMHLNEKLTSDSVFQKTYPLTFPRKLHFRKATLSQQFRKLSLNENMKKTIETTSSSNFFVSFNLTILRM